MSESSMIVEKLNHLVEKSGHLHVTLAIVAEIPLPELSRKLAGHEDFTVSDIAGLSRALGFSMSALFATTTFKEEKPCTVKACERTAHRYENGYRVDYCRLPPIIGEGFSVNGHLSDEDQWAAWVDPDDIPDGWEGVARTRELVSAFEQMQTRCDDLNGHSLERHTEPGEPDQQGIGGGL